MLSLLFALAMVSFGCLTQFISMTYDVLRWIVFSNMLVRVSVRYCRERFVWVDYQLIRPITQIEQWNGAVRAWVLWNDCAQIIGTACA
jgi:hypothetical protein